MSCVCLLALAASAWRATAALGPTNQPTLSLSPSQSAQVENAFLSLKLDSRIADRYSANTWTPIGHANRQLGRVIMCAKLTSANETVRRVAGDACNSLTAPAKKHFGIAALPDPPQLQPWHCARTPRFADSQHTHTHSLFIYIYVFVM